MHEIPDVTDILGWGSPGAAARPSRQARPAPSPSPVISDQAFAVPAARPRPLPSPALANTSPATSAALRAASYALVATQQEVMTSGLRADPQMCQATRGRYAAQPAAPQASWSAEDALVELAGLEG